MLHFPICRMLSDEESRDRMEDADSNEDGKVSWDEIVNDTYGSDPQDLAYDDTLIRNDLRTFKVADLNQDNYLDTEEFKAFTHPEETPWMLDVVLNQTFQEYDKDLDRYISFQEFLGNRAAVQDKEWLLVEKDKFDHEYDKNGDGRLDITEVQAWLVPSSE